MADGRIKEGLFQNNRFVERRKVNLPDFDHTTAAMERTNERGFHSSQGLRGSNFDY